MSGAARVEARPARPPPPAQRAPLTAPAAARLKPLLDAFVEDRPWRERIAADPVEFPHRYVDPRDREVAALIAASLAYGRASFFKPKVDELLGRLGPAPAQTLARLVSAPSAVSCQEMGARHPNLDGRFDVAAVAPLCRGFVYRFNVPADLATLFLGIGWALQTHGSLEGLFVAQLEQAGGDWRGALSGFTRALREAAPAKEVRTALGRTRGLDHLLPTPSKGGAAKRLNLFLRWMVRGPDQVDLGVWRSLSPAQLVMPVDTHIARIGKWLGLTRRSDLSWRTAEEITASLRLLDAADPTRYDFALCHYGMSGACPVKSQTRICVRCPLNGACSVGRRRVGRVA